MAGLLLLWLVIYGIWLGLGALSGISQTLTDFQIRNEAPCCTPLSNNSSDWQKEFCFCPITGYYTISTSAFPEEILKYAKDCDGILTIPDTILSKDLILKLPESVKIISNYAVGFGNIDVDTAANKGIIVTNTPDVLTDATADISILLLLGASRRAYEGRKAAETKNWKWYE